MKQATPIITKFLCHIAVIVFVALACGIPAFCGEIHDASKAGDLEKVKALLKDIPALVSSKDKYGVTPLHLAAAKGHKDIAILILDKGGDVNAEADFGSTPLDMAIAIDSKEIVELFRRHGGRVGSGVLIFDIDKPPEALVMPMPRITEKARIARIDPGFGSMKLQFIIRKDGTVDNIKVIKALGYGMEESAIKTIGKWRFKPATLNGNPIDVGVNYEMRCDVF